MFTFGTMPLNQQFFGRRLPDETPMSAYWGARAIWTRGVLDIPWDRKCFHPDPVPEDFKDWLLKKAPPWLDDLMKSGPEHVFRLDDGAYHCEAGEQSSYGYIYICAWKD